MLARNKKDGEKKVRPKKMFEMRTQDLYLFGLKEFFNKYFHTS